MYMHMCMYMYIYIYICIEKGSKSARHKEQQHFRDSENVLRAVRDTDFDKKIKNVTRFVSYMVVGK